MRSRISAALPTFWAISCFGPLGHQQRKAHVFGDGLVRIERIGLEHHGNVAVLRHDVIDHAAADPDFARDDRFQTGDHAQQRGLAAAGGADEHDEFAILDIDIDPVHHLHGLP